MRHNSRRTHRPSSTRMDKKAGEMQGMSELPDTIDLNNEKHVELMLQEFEKRMKEIEYVSEKTHVDLSEMKTQVAQIKEATEAPIYDYVKKQEANEREREKLE